MNSRNLKSDCLIFDLENVSMQHKGQARNNVFQTLESMSNSKIELCVRINSIGSGLDVDDLSVVLRSKSLVSIVIPKVVSQQEIEFVSRMIQSVAPESTNYIKIIASIENAKAIMQIREIATSDARVNGLMFAAEDYCADTGIKRTRRGLEMLYARQRVVTAACAFGLDAIDMVCTDFKNSDILREECEEGSCFGFVGKQAIHPGQLETINSCFGNSTEEISRAQKIISLYKEHSKQGKGAFEVDGKMVDQPVVKWAEKILAKNVLD